MMRVTRSCQPLASALSTDALLARSWAARAYGWWCLWMVPIDGAYRWCSSPRTASAAPSQSWLWIRGLDCAFLNSVVCPKCTRGGGGEGYFPALEPREEQNLFYYPGNGKSRANTDVLLHLRAPREVPEVMYKATFSRTFSKYEEPGAGRIEKLVALRSSDRFMTPAL